MTSHAKRQMTAIAMLVCVLICTSAQVRGNGGSSDSILTFSTGADYTNLLKNGITTYTGTVGNGAAAADSLDWLVDNNGTGGLVLSGSGTALAAGTTTNVTGTYTGSAYGTLNVVGRATGTDNADGDPAVNSPLTAGTSITVGEALAYKTLNNGEVDKFGDVFSADVAAAGSYAGLASKVVGLLGGGSDFVGSEAILRFGTNTGANTTVTMAWRNRTDLEDDPRNYTAVGPMQWGDPTYHTAAAYDSHGDISDGVDVEGINGLYVLQMSYDESEINWPSGHTTDTTLAAGGYIHLGWFEDVAGDSAGRLATYREWVNAVANNSATGGSAVPNYQGSYDAFIAAYDDPSTGFLSSPSSYLGSWGVDVTGDEVWAVLDHTSQFMVVPEPATLMLLAGGFGPLLRRRRK